MYLHVFLEVSRNIQMSVYSFCMPEVWHVYTENIHVELPLILVWLIPEELWDELHATRTLWLIADNSRADAEGPTRLPVNINFDIIKGFN